jgi:hypothetical protein
MDVPKEPFMNFNQTEQRRTFMKVVVGVSSAAWASWASANASATAFKVSTLETQLLRLPHNSEPMVVSGRVTNSQNKPCCGQSVVSSTEQVVTDADGRFWIATSTKELQNANIASNKQIVHHQLTQDPSGVWRLYLELST